VAVVFFVPMTKFRNAQLSPAYTAVRPSTPVVVRPFTPRGPTVHPTCGASIRPARPIHSPHVLPLQRVSPQVNSLQSLHIQSVARGGQAEGLQCGPEVLGRQAADLQITAF